MKFTRSMVLVSNDPESARRGAPAIFERFQDEIAKLGLTEEISVATISDVDRHDALPLVIIYQIGRAHV